MMPPDDGTQLFTQDGSRKYISETEWRLFVEATAGQDPRGRGLCRLLAYTGARITEALAVTSDQLDEATGAVVFRTLKRRKRHFRAVPLPPELLLELRELGRAAPGERIWPWCRQTGWRRVKAVMTAAGVHGARASPRGLRHGFGVANAERSIPIGLTSRWMGHARLETTATIYQHVLGDEEREFARRLWRRANRPG